MTVNTNILQVLENKKLRANYSYVFDGWKGYYVKGDEKLMPDELEAKLPIEIKDPLTKGQLIGKANWMN